MATRTNTELKVFLEGTLTQYNALTDKAGTVFFDSTNHALYVEGVCVMKSAVENVTYNDSTTELTITAFGGAKTVINLGIQRELDLLQDKLEDWVADNFTSNTIFETELDKKVDKVNGKGLSSNDYTDSDRDQLRGTEPGAQKNRQITVNEEIVGTDANTGPITITGNLIRAINSEGGELAISLYGEYDSGQKKIFFRTDDTTDAEDLFVIDATDFIKDSFVKAGSYNSDKQALILTLVTGKDNSGNDITEDIEIPVGALIDEYTAGDGIVVNNNQFSANLGNGLQFDNTVNNKKITLKLSDNSGLNVTTNGLAVDWTKAPVQSVNGLTGDVKIEGKEAYIDDTDDDGSGEVGFKPFEVAQTASAITLGIDREGALGILAMALQKAADTSLDGWVRFDNIDVYFSPTSGDSEAHVTLSSTPKVWQF